MARDFNRENLALTGRVPRDSGPGSINAEPPRNAPALDTLRRRGVPGRDKNLRRFDIPLDTAYTKAAPRRFAVTGNRVAVMRTTFETDLCEIRFEGRSDWVPLGPGSEIGGQPFSYIEVSNDASAGSTVVLVIGTEYPGDPLYFRQR